MVDAAAARSRRTAAMTAPDGVDPELARRLRKAMANAIVDVCRRESPTQAAIIIPFPEVADALVSLFVAMAGEMELFDSFQQVEAFATGIARFACERMRSLGHAAKLLFPLRG